MKKRYKNKYNSIAGIEYQVLQEVIVGNKQWSNWISNGNLAGFEQNNKKIYAIKIKLTNTEAYSVKYRVHRQYQGVINWYKVKNYGVDSAMIRVRIQGIWFWKNSL